MSGHTWLSCAEAQRYGSKNLTPEQQSVRGVCCALTDAIPEGSVAERIIFTTKNCALATGNWVWFEACIIRGNQDQSQTKQAVEAFQRCLNLVGKEFETLGLNRRWHVHQSDDPRNTQMLTQSTTWRRQVPFDRIRGENDRYVSGALLVGADFIGSLCEGDRVGLIARMRAGTIYENYIQSAQVEIACTWS